MEYRLRHKERYQENILSSKELHNKIVESELERRKGEIDICVGKQNFVHRAASNKMILCTGNNAQLALEASQYVSNKLNEFEILLQEDKRIEEMLKENKYNFEVAGQN